MAYLGPSLVIEYCTDGTLFQQRLNYLHIGAVKQYPGKSFRKLLEAGGEIDEKVSEEEENKSRSMCAGEFPLAVKRARSG